MRSNKTMLPERKPIRLNCFDYSSNGAYFVTLCVENRKKILSQIVGERIALPKQLPKVHLTQIGEKVKNSIENIPKHYSCVKVDEYVIMPNHIHLILE